MIEAVRKINFCSGHRVYKHESKCNNLHGHNYTLFIHVQSKDGLDDLGRVIDFSVIKNVAKKWIDENLDHSFIVYEKDNQVLDIFSTLDDQKYYILKANPTAENIALHLLNDIFPKLFSDYGIVVKKLILWETENCYVEVYNEFTAS